MAFKDANWYQQQYDSKKAAVLALQERIATAIAHDEFSLASILCPDLQLQLNALNTVANEWADKQT